MIAMLAMKILVRTVKVMMMATSHRSAETMDSLEDGPAPPLEGTRSERQIPRSRPSGRSTPASCPQAPQLPEYHPQAPQLPEYNLRTFEKSLLKSKETTL